MPNLTTFLKREIMKDTSPSLSQPLCKKSEKVQPFHFLLGRSHFFITPFEWDAEFSATWQTAAARITVNQGP
jgi:hypothetical protein